MHAVNAVTAQRLEQMVREAMALADVTSPDADMDRGSRVERLLAAMDGVKEFSVAGRLTREELHAR